MIMYFKSNSSIEASGRGLITEGTSTSVSFLWNLLGNSTTNPPIGQEPLPACAPTIEVPPLPANSPGDQVQSPVAQKSELTKLEIVLIVICAVLVVVIIALSIKIMKKPQHSFEVIQ